MLGPVRFNCQHAAMGKSMIDGPGPLSTCKRTTCCVGPCATISSGSSGITVGLDTHKILLERCGKAGTNNG
jgi:hypothetical protein